MKKFENNIGIVEAEDEGGCDHCGGACDGKD
jgi:hypothetical protein